MNGINAFMQSFYSWLQFEIENLKSHSIALKKYLTLLVKIGVFTAINLALYESMLLLRGLPQWSFISLFTTALSGVSLSGFVYVGALMAVGFTLGVSARKGVSMFKSFFNSNRLTQKKSGGTRKRRKRNLQKVESSIEHRAVNDRRLVSRAPLSPNQNAESPHAATTREVPLHEGGLLSRISYWSKFAVANALGIYGLIAVARVFPPARGLFEYSYWQKVDYLHLAIAADADKEAAKIIDLVQGDVLHRMMKYHWAAFGNSTILSTIVEMKKLTLFEKILQKLTPEQRFEHLTAIVDVGCFEGMVIQHIAPDFGRKKPFWKMTLKYLPPEWQIKLITHTDQRGDSFLHHLLKATEVGYAKNLLVHLDKEQIKAVLNTACPHGITPLMRFFGWGSLIGTQRLLALLPDEDWREIFAYKPAGWSMTHGEKIMAISTELALYSARSSGKMAEDWSLYRVFHDRLPPYLEKFDEEKVKRYLKEDEYDYDANIEASTYLAEVFGLKLPDYLYELDRSALIKELHKTDTYNKSANCDSSENFKKVHGVMPNEVLENTDPWPMYSALNQRYKTLMLSHHPDKHMNAPLHKRIEAEEKSRILNKAHDFVCNRKVRISYSS